MSESKGKAPDGMLMKVAGMIGPHLEKAGPYIAKAGELLDKAEPYVLAFIAYCQHIWTKLEPYHPMEFLPAIVGFILVFFGGNFFTLCATFEAYRLVGYDKTKEALVDLYHSYTVAIEASRKDDVLDEDGDGVADVKQISKKQLVVRKMSVVAKAVDPERVSDALTAIYAGLIAVVATLRVRFAACVTLGTTVGDIAHGFVDAHLSPVLRELTPDDYKKWVGPGVKYGCKLFGISMAWTIQRMISAYHSSVRGAQLFARGVLHYMVRRGYLQANAVDETGRFFNIFIFVFAFVGFWNQFMTGFSLPFPLNILLIPVRMAEFGMQVAVSMLG